MRDELSYRGCGCPPNEGCVGVGILSEGCETNGEGEADAGWAVEEHTEPGTGRRIGPLEMPGAGRWSSA